VAGEPVPPVLSPNVQAKVKLPSPPDAEALNVRAVPGAATLWSTDAVTEGVGLMTTSMEFDPLRRVESTAVQVAVNVLAEA
jgi:hypothetical protein